VAPQRARVVQISDTHFHCAFHLDRAVWAPSLTRTSSDPVTGADPRPGLVEHTLATDGSHDHRVVRPWALSG